MKNPCVSRRAAVRGLAAFLCAAALAVPASALFPAYLNYQGKLGDTSGNPLTGTYSFRFKLFAQASGGAALFSEDVTGADALNVTNGLYSVQFGSYTAGGIPASAFSGDETWLEIDVKSGSTLTGAETLAPRERLTTGPFAFRALHAEKLGVGVNIATFTSAGLMTFPYEVRAASASFTSGVTASTGTFTGNAFSVGGSTLVVAGGNVGIGTTAPATLLDVNGSVQIGAGAAKSTFTAAGDLTLAANADLSLTGPTGYLSSQSSITTTSGLFAGSISCDPGPCGGVVGWTNSSDRRLKTDIRTISGALDKILRLDGVSYRWKDAKLDKSQGEKIGLVAQDVEKVFPQAVRTDPAAPGALPGGTKMLAYTDLIGPLVEAIKELNRKTVLLEERVVELERKLAHDKEKTAEHAE